MELPDKVQVWCESPLRDATGRIVRVTVVPYTHGKKGVGVTREMGLSLAEALRRQGVGFELRDPATGAVLVHEEGCWAREFKEQEEKHGY